MKETVLDDWCYLSLLFAYLIMLYTSFLVLYAYCIYIRCIVKGVMIVCSATHVYTYFDGLYI